MAIPAVKARLRSGSITLTGSEAHQIRALYIRWTAFKRDCVQKGLLEPEWIDLVIEDFVLFPGERPGKVTTSPERIAWGFEGYRMAMLDSYHRKWRKHFTEITWQKAGAAHRFNNQKILKQADAWVVGRQHERSAFAHLILRLNTVLDQNRRP